MEATDRNVFILGAGFSASAGAPMIHDFLERSRRFINASGPTLSPLAQKHFKSVFAFKAEMAKCREKIAMDLDNIESLFGLVELGTRLGLSPQEVRDSTVFLIVKTLALCTMNGVRRSRVGFNISRDLSQADSLPATIFSKVEGQTSVKYLADMYDFFAFLLAGGFDEPSLRATRKTTVITFNYDLILDDAFNRIGVYSDYGLPIGVPPLPGTPMVSLLKLHGSANWGICPSCELKVYLPDKITEIEHMVSCDSCGKPIQPLLVPPSWDKSEYRKIILPIWKSAVTELQAATRICIIGYSMPESDAFFQYLITLALAANHQLERLIVVDKGTQAQAKWDRLLEPIFKKRRFFYHPEEFLGFLVGSGSHGRLNRGELLAGNIVSY